MAALLNESLDRLRNGHAVEATIDELISDFRSRRMALTREEWQNWIAAEVRPHPLLGALYEDPFVRHSATRPRGYPGDAELLDYIYGNESVRPMIRKASELGRRLYAYSFASQAPLAVRNRRAL